MKHFFVILFFCASSFAQEPSPGPIPAPTPTPASSAEVIPLRKVVGVLKEKGTKKRLSGVNVFILPAKLKAVTDLKGEFSFDQVQEGGANFVVNQAGYKKLDRNITIKENIEVTFYLEKLSYQTYETTITDRANRNDVVVRSLGKEDFLTMPGANGDPVKAVQNLPGVARTGFSSNIIIQGSAPQDTQYLIDDLNVPLVFHFGGLTSVVMPEEIDSVDYYSAGFGPEYSRAMGGIIGLHTKSPATDRMKGLAFIDTMKSGAMLEGPINDHSSYLVSGRYSYLGFVLAAALKGNDQVDLTVAPSFYDVSGIYLNHLGPNDDFKFTTITSHDELKFVFKQPVKTDPSIRGDFDNETSFVRFIPQWTHKFSEDAQSKVAMGLGRDWFMVDFGSNFFQLATYNADLKADLEEKYSKSWVSNFGIDTNFVETKYSFRLPAATRQGGISNPISGTSTVNADVKRDDIDTGFYFKNTIDLFSADNKIMPSLRFDYFSQTHQFLMAPRLADRYALSESLAIKGATGIYYQPPQAQEVDTTYGNPNLSAPYAYHLALGVEKDFKQNNPSGFNLTAGPFYRDFRNLVIQSSAVNSDGSPQRYSNQGTGTAYGVEALLKWQTKGMSSFISYTISKSTRTQPIYGTSLFQYDQTHNFNWVASLDSGNWKYSGRLRYVTGDPNTPVTGAVFDSDNDVYDPSRGPLYSSRVGAFFSLDIRIDKKWIYDTWILSAYLDVENTTNNKNPESVTYSYNYSQSATVNGLPILPTLGVQGEF